MHFEVLGSKTYKSETLFAGFVKFGYGALVESFVLVINQLNIMLLLDIPMSPYPPIFFHSTN